MPRKTREKPSGYRNICVPIGDFIQASCALPVDEYEAIRREASRLDISISEYIRRAIRAFRAES